MKQIQFLLLLFILFFLLNCCSDSTEPQVQDNLQPEKTEQQPITATISYLNGNPFSDSLLTDTLYSFNLTTANLAELNGMAKMNLAFESRSRIVLEVINYENLGDPYIIFGFEDNGESPDLRKGFRHIGDRYGRITMVHDSSHTVRFNGILYGFVFDELNWIKVPEIHRTVTVDDSLMGTLKIKPAIHKLSAAHMLRVSGYDQPDILNRKNVTMQISGRDSLYWSAVIFKSGGVLSAKGIRISGDISDSYSAYFFSYSPAFIK